MSRYRIDVAYDGTNYAGWQIQADADTIQERLESALTGITGESPRVFGSGRTDAGVHARRQVAHFDSGWNRAERQLVPGLNAALPGDIRVSNLQSVPDDFHAQFDAIGKEYRYRVWNGRVVPPFLRLYRHRMSVTLDDGAMRDAARRLEGEHDFAAFAANPNEEREGTVRILHAVEILRDGEDLCFRVAGNGFLYKMVRGLAGFLVEVGRGKLPPDSADRFLASGKRSREVITSPAAGLFLWDVEYPELD